MRKHEDPKFLALRNAGKSYEEISLVFGCRPATVMGWVTSAIKDGLTKAVVGKWPDDKVAALRALWVARVHVDEVARQLDTTRLAVEGQVLRHGIKRPDMMRVWTDDLVGQLRSLKASGKSDAQVSVIMGMTENAIRKARRNHDIGSVFDQSLWSDKATDDLKRMWDQELNPAEIGRRLGMTRMKVQSKAARMKLPMNRGTPVVRKKANRSYDTVAAAARARKGTTMKPRPQAGPKEESNVIPLTARPWLSRQRGECAYPYGPRGQIHSCCKPVWSEGIYCESHAALCYTERFGKVA